MRGRAPRLLDNNVMCNDDLGGNDSLRGIREYNHPSTTYPSTPYTFQYPDLHHENNYVCAHFNSVLWKEEQRFGLNCCNRGKYIIHPLQPVSAELMDILSSSRFQRAQIRYNGLFSFTALGVGQKLAVTACYVFMAKHTIKYLISSSSMTV